MGNGAKIAVAVVFGVVVYNWAGRHFAPSSSGIESARATTPRVEAPRCRAADFTVENISGSRNKFGTMWIVGKVTNNGALPCGVKLKASSYDKAGAVRDVADFWAGSTNISPGASENFKHYLTDKENAARNFDVVPIEARNIGER